LTAQTIDRLFGTRSAFDQPLVAHAVETVAVLLAISPSPSGCLARPDGRVKNS